MRLRVNKTCKTLDDNNFNDFYTKFQWYLLEYPNLLEPYPHMELDCKYCANCGTEFFGLWLWLQISFEIDDELIMQSEYREYEEQRVIFEKNIEQIRNKEIENFQTMSVCPVCNEPFKPYHYDYIKHRYMGLHSLHDNEILGKILGLYKSKSDGKQWEYTYNLYTQVPKEIQEQGLEEVLDKIFKKLKDKYIPGESPKEKALALTNDFINCYDRRAEFSLLDTKDTNAIKGDVEKLKEYLLNIITLENNVYSLTKRLNYLYEKRILNDMELKAVSYDPVIEVLKKIDKETNSISDSISETKKKIDILTTELGAINFNRDELVGRLTKPTEPQFKKVGLFNKANIIEYNNQLQQEYEVELKKYNQEVEELNKQIDGKIVVLENSISQNKQILDELSNKNNQLLKEGTLTPAKFSDIPLCAEKVMHDLLDEEINIVEDLLKKTLDGIKRLYDLNIIFGKYRDVVAVTTFYEYIVSGRCSDLDGPNGAYNIYESECRANIIISKLSEVVSVLEEIKEVQYMIYSAINNINFELKTLNNTMDKTINVLSSIEYNTTDIAKNSQVIAYNTEKTAYYSKKTAELTNALGYMIALN